MKEAVALIKMNKLLHNSVWQFFADAKGPASIQLDPSGVLKPQDLSAGARTTLNAVQY